MDKDFAYYVTECNRLRAERDDKSFALGDEAADFEITLGRPDDPDAPTLGDLAREINMSTQRLSELRNVAKFYPTDARTFDTSWEVYNMARRASANSLDNALELLETATAQAMTVKDFRRYLQGIYYEGPIQVHLLPGNVRPIIPSGEREVWAVFKRKDGNQ